MSKAFRLDQMATALVPPPTATFSWLLADLMAVAGYLAEVEKLKRRHRRGDARKGGAHD